MAGHVISPEFNAGEHTDAAALIGTAAPAIKSMAEPIYEELGLVRIQRWQAEELGRPELAGAKLAAAAGARLRSGTGCGALGRLRAGPRDSPECTECNGELGCGLRRLWPRRRGAAAAMASAMVGNGATARERREEGRGNGKKLTAITQSSTAGSGETW